MDPVVERAHEAFERLNRLMLDQMEEQGMRPTCRDQCYFCCKEPTSVDRREVLNMLRALDAEQIARVKERAWAWAEKITGTRLLSLTEPHVLEYRVQNLWCPFLEDGRCMAYARRPLACRAHTAIGPVERCEHEDLRLSQQYATSPEITTMATLALSQGTDEIYMDHLGCHLVELLHGVRMASQNRIILRVPEKTEVPPVRRETVSDDE